MCGSMTLCCCRMVIEVVKDLGYFFIFLAIIWWVGDRRDGCPVIRLARSSYQMDQ